VLPHAFGVGNSKRALVVAGKSINQSIKWSINQSIYFIILTTIWIGYIYYLLYLVFIIHILLMQFIY
jgi:hypothetical protein